MGVKRAKDRDDINYLIIRSDQNGVLIRWRWRSLPRWVRRAVFGTGMLAGLAAARWGPHLALLLLAGR
jgi:hypothetical protein